MLLASVMATYTVKNLLQKEKKEKRYNEQPTHKTAHSQAQTHKSML